MIDMVPKNKAITVVGNTKDLAIFIVVFDLNDLTVMIK